MQKDKFNRRCRRAFPSCNIKENTLKWIRNFSRGCLRISPKLRPSTGVLLHHKLFEETGLLLEKDKVWKEKLKPKDVRQKIKVMIFPLDSMESNSRNEDIQTDTQQISNGGNVDNEDSTANHLEKVASESEEEDVSVDQALQNTSENSQKGNESFPCQVTSPVKSESSDEMVSSSLNLSSLQEMFGRMVVGNCPQNLTCRLLHTETVAKTMRNFVECKRENEYEGKIPENFHDMKSMKSSWRVNSLGYKFASKMFQFFI